MVDVDSALSDAQLKLFLATTKMEAEEEELKLLRAYADLLRRK